MLTALADLPRPRSLNEAWCRTLVDALIAGGLVRAVVAPGSRSTPLALALAERGLELHVVVDERSAAFFALGIAKAAAAPVLALCTSGSAGAHFLPAVIEAHATHVPLVVVTADRPPELHGFGAHQSIDQTRLFGPYAEFTDLGAPIDDAHAFRHLRALAARALAHSGVTHWNAPFREPLAPPADGTFHVVDAAPPTGPLGSTRTLRRADTHTVRALAAILGDARRPAFLVGPVDDPALHAPLLLLARRLRAPVLAEVASSLRDGAARDVVIAHTELMLRAGLAPEVDVLVRVGGTPTTRGAMAFADAVPRGVVVGTSADPGHTAEPFAGDAVALLSDVLAALAVVSTEAGWLDAVVARDARIARVLADLDRADAGATLDEPAVARGVASSVGRGDVLMLASSMPIRDVEAFAGNTAPAVRVLTNRGACGIDGLISTAAGAALASAKETTLLLGDLAMLHDIGGLVAARAAAACGARLRIVVVNNDGGGIFSFLPVAERASAAHFEQLFGTPHGLGFAEAAAFIGAPYACATTLGELRGALERLHPPKAGGVVVIEARTDRATNRAIHDSVTARVRAAERP